MVIILGTILLIQHQPKKKTTSVKKLVDKLVFLFQKTVFSIFKKQNRKNSLNIKTGKFNFLVHYL